MSDSKLKSLVQGLLQPFYWLKQLFLHPYSCFMLASIQYNNAMFHIFSGPLFANVEGYVYLDLMIWGISPLLYLLFRPTLYKIIKPELPIQKISETNQTDKLIKQIKKHKKHLNFIHKKRLFLLIAFSVAIFFSFLFMNYSQTFNWNYFTRIINMDLGYLIFDFACRSMQLIVQIQEEEQIEQKYHRSQTQYQLQQAIVTVFKFQRCKIYCKFKNIAMFLSYTVVFLLFTNGFDVNQRYSGQQVLAVTSILSCIVTFVTPFLYFFHFKTKYFQKWAEIIESKSDYKVLKQQQQKSQQSQIEPNNQVNDQKSIQTRQQIQNQLRKIKRIICKENKPCSPPTHFGESQEGVKSVFQKVKYVIQSKQLFRPLVVFILAYFSWVINVSYLALWIMQTLKHQQNYIQYNETLLITSVFFMVGSGLFAISSKINLNYPFQLNYNFKQKKQDQFSELQSLRWSYYINKVFLFILGVIMVLSFTSIKDNIYMFIFSTIGLGFHLALINFIYFGVQKILQQADLDIDLEILSLYLETIAYLIVPVIITLTQTTDFTYAIYGWISALSMIVAALIL